MKKIISRNDKCWCGSQIKFKNCHQLKKLPYPSTRIDVDKAKAYFFSLPECQAIEKNKCSDDVIRAHTISKSANLKPIAENGHVLSFAHYKVNQTLEEYWKPSLIGINKVSTLPCFCSYHDTYFFKEIDKKKFEFSPENIFFLSYRAFMREVYEKKQSVKLFKLSREFLIKKLNIYQYNESLRGENLAWNIIEYNRIDYEKIIKEKSYNKFYSKVFKLPRSLKIVCSGAVIIDVDIFGNTLQNVYEDNHLKSIICVNTVYNDDDLYVVLGWTDKSKDIAEILIKSFDESIRLVDDMVYFLFIHFENICMNPSWYITLEENTKKLLSGALVDGCRPHIPREKLFPLKENLNLDK